jgi:peptidoglycan/LPS O-acetylase OafA/YrhL
VTAVGRSKAGRFPCFDGLRAIAAIAVLVTHVSFVTTANRVVGGSYFARFDSGVAIFFVISGFLLYRPFVAAALGGEAVGSTGAFLWRRALRIFPAYWLAALTIALVFGVKPWDGFGDALTHLALVHIYDPETVVSGPISQAWSLGTEITYYLALPALGAAAALLARRTDRRVGPQLAFVGALMALSLGYRWLVAEHGGERASAMATWLPGYLDQFGLGMVLAVASAWYARRGRDEGPVWLGAGWVPATSWLLAIASLSAAAFVVDLPTTSLDYSTGQLLGRQVTYGLWGFFLVVPAVFGPQDRGVVRWVLRSRVVGWLGMISYGIYLWHQFFIDRFQRWTDTPIFGGNFGLAVAIVLAGSVVTAAASYVAVERPILSLKDRWPARRGDGVEPVPAGPAGTGSAVPATGA